MYDTFNGSWSNHTELVDSGGLPFRAATKSKEKYLESFSLGCDDRDDGLGLIVPMTYFMTFNTFKVFKTAALFFVQTDNGIHRDNLSNTFPPSLETLHLAHFHPCVGRLLKVLEHLISQNSSQQLPLLKRLILETKDCYRLSFTTIFCENYNKMHPIFGGGSHMYTIERLRTISAAHGVSVEVIG